jgi:hypothetical protein
MDVTPAHPRPSQEKQAVDGHGRKDRVPSVFRSEVPELVMCRFVPHGCASCGLYEGGFASVPTEVIIRQEGKHV